MAQIDTSIYGNLLARPRSVADYSAEIDSVRLGQTRNLIAKGQLEDTQRAHEDAGRLRSLQSGWGADTTDEQRSSGLKNLGRFDLADGLDKSLLERQKTQADVGYKAAQAEKEQLSTAISKQAQIAQAAGAATDQASWERGLQVAASLGIDISQIPQRFDPNIAKTIAQQAMTGAQQLEQHWKQKGYDLDVRKQGEVERNNVAQTDTTRRGQDITMRGQNMTDSRARDFNAVQVEANNIKRGEKKDVADLTKSSQLASFDTMLGTLDRLGAHPGLSRSVGIPGAFPTMPGSNSANFQAELNTFQSQAFLPMVAQLKGMGALSDAEGKKLTAAVGALDPKMGEQAFRDSVGRITSDMQAARARLSGEQPAAKPAAQSAPKAGAVQGGYRFKGGDPADKANWAKL